MSQPKRKSALLIRHGQSKFNQAFESGRCRGDPMIFDAPLTEKGRRQAIARGEQLRAEGRVFDLVITSPLTRAIETSLLIFGEAVPMLVTPHVREALHSSCDVGRDPDELARDFPALAGHVAHLPKQWWGGSYAAEYAQRGGVHHEHHESEEEMRARLWKLVDMVEQHPAERIAIVGHGTLFSQIIGEYINNCETHEWNLEHGLLYCKCRRTDGQCACE